jgi:hypothetical protein
MYVPEIGQTDAAARAAALNAGLSVPDTADAPRYARIRGQLPCVVLEWGEEIVVVAEPTDLAAVDAAAALLQQAADDAEAAAVPAGPPVTLSLNEAGNLIIVAVEYSDGTVRTGAVPLI